MRGCGKFFVMGLAGLLVGAGVPLSAEAAQSLVSLYSLNPAIAQISCGEEIIPLSFYENISLYSLIAGFALVFTAIFLEQKKIKLGLGLAALAPFLIWGYVNFLVDYDKIRKTIFNFNLQEEATLANIAEAQERYQSEQGNFIKDLKVLESHLAGAHGMDECVKIIDLNVGFDHWSAVA